MVIDTLRQHPRVIGFGEILNPGRVGFMVDGFDSRSAKLNYLRNRYPVDFLDRFIFGGYEPDVRAVGFKVFPEQLDDPRFTSVWQWLTCNRHVKVILLSRHNLLRAYVSLEIARKTGRYGIQDTALRPTLQLTLDPDRCVEAFETRAEYNRRARESVRSHDVLEMQYETLAADVDAGLRCIQEFIDVDVRQLRTRTVKKEIRRLSEIILNYEQITDRLTGTRWEYCLD
jgi:hypothetical protein